MSVGGSEHKVFLYKNDFNTMCSEVYRHQHIETGGNLFGLWTTSGNAVIHVVVGPGKDCKRTDVSFNQDIEYMKRVGEFLNEKFMLCHIGEWHSHHHLTLNKPSDGDRRTVRNNFPQGMKKFLVIIANVVGTDTVVLSPYFFADGGRTCLKAELQVLDADSPFTMDSTIARELGIGSENQQSQSEPAEPMDTNNQPSRDNSRRSANQQQSSGGNPSLASGDNRTAFQRNKHSSSSVTDDAGAVKSGSGDASARNSSTTPQAEIPPPDYPGADSSSQQNGRNSSLNQTMDTGVPDHESGRPSASQTPTATNPSSSNLLQNDENEKQTRKDIMLKKVYDEIQSNFHPQEIDIQGNSSGHGDIKMKFKHKDYSWLIEFPKRFPEEPAKISSCFHYQKPERFVECLFMCKPKTLNNYINILLSIKRSCSSVCSPCKKMTAESLTQADSSLSLFLTEKGNAMLEELYDKTETKSCVADPGSFKREMKYDSIEDEAILKVSFTHSSKPWVVTLTSTFPDSPAKVEYKGNYGGLYSVRLRSADYTLKNLNSVSNILLAISKECRCEKCKDFAKKNNAI